MRLRLKHQPLPSVTLRRPRTLLRGMCACGMTTLHVIYDDTRRADIIVKLMAANLQATAIRRTGYIGIRGWAYGVLHNEINGLLDELEALT